MKWVSAFFKEKVEMHRIKWSFSYDAEYIYFFLTDENDMSCELDLLDELDDRLDASDQNKKYILWQAIEQGTAVYIDKKIRFDNNMNLFTLPTEELASLEIAGFYRMGLSIRANGMLHTKDLKYEYEYIDANGRTLIGIKRVGVFLEYGKKRFLLPEVQYSLLEALEKFNGLDSTEKEYEGNLIRFSKIKGLSIEAGAKLDQYLQRENVVTVDNIGVHINFIDKETIEVLPFLKNKEGDEIQNEIDKFSTVQSVYNLSKNKNDNGRTRVVLSERAQNAATEVKRLPMMRGQMKDEFLKNPQKFVDPEVIDIEEFQISLDKYSDRVQGIGEYKLVGYSFESDEKNPWIFESNVNQKEKSLNIKNSVELQEFEEALKKAKAEKMDNFSWKNKSIPTAIVTDDYLQNLQEEISNREIQKEEKKEPEIYGIKKKILLIKENIQDLDYNIETTITDFIECKPELPNCFADDITLMDHQKKGVSWLQALFRAKQGGGLLADDMGLGKTLQVLSFIVWQMGEIHTKPSLIIAPVVLLENWNDEYEKFFTKDILIVNLHGKELANLRCSKKEKGPEYLNEPRVSLNTKVIEQADIVFTTYEAVRDYQFSLGQIDWSVVVTDESQKIKTPSALVTAAVKALKADFRIACTATPVENSLVDLWCIMDFAKPGKLGSLKEYLNEFVYSLNKQDVSRDYMVDLLQTAIQPCFLRRLKQDVLLHLPKKHEHYEYVPMSPIQVNQYISVVEAYKVQKEKNVQGAMLKVLHQIRGIASFPDIGEDSFAGSYKELMQFSGKTCKLVDILKSIKILNEKVIIFTEQRRFQRIIARVVSGAFGFSPAIVNGEISGSKSASSGGVTRKKIIDKFQQASDFGVIVMSPQAAGYGLNIVGANHVIHFSRMWNPAKEDQATDRVYRIGQVRPVHVYYLISKDPNHQFICFDERLQELLQRKRNLATDFLYPSDEVGVTPDEFGDLITPVTTLQSEILEIVDIDNLKPLLFEAAIAALFEKMKYTTFATVGSGDYGVDVVCMSNHNEKENILIQCKQSGKSLIGFDAVTEVSAARALYQNKMLVKFEKMFVITNQKLNQNAISMAKANQVGVIDRKILKKLLTEHEITMKDIYIKHSSRQKI